MCLEFLRYFISRHETIRCPSETIEVGVVLRFSLVDLSRRRAVLLRGGPRRKGLGGINTYTCPTFMCTLELRFVILVVPKSDGYCCICGSTASTSGSTAVGHGSTAPLEP